MNYPKFHRFTAASFVAWLIAIRPMIARSITARSIRLIAARLVPALLLALLTLAGRAQSPRPTYPSLLWEISGNGLKQPSYLFGSMHVSNKMVFHLSDSFYTAIASCDMVSLEVDPKEWQPDMFRLDEAKNVATKYEVASDNDFMSETDFRVGSYQDALRAALREEPLVMNGLLYRTNSSQANFQENTYLDLYIYQTARRLGKRATGVENYLETERLSEESTFASLKEKRERRILPEGESEMTILNKLQDAYRRGDLTLLDSLNGMLSYSKAFNEKFMYPRNEIQANAIDSIIHHKSLFVAVGAAHLPGSQGVIERLRKKGYTVRPVKMTDQDAHTREAIDKMHVPVEWQPATSDDGFIRCSLPGPWFRRNEISYNESWQYADMENGSYYMLTRVKTNAGIAGESSETVRLKIDSLLYENVPGKILQKKSIGRNGYPGFEITNKTRVGDMQRYLILVTPFEILLFKMSGNEDYVSGKDADSFFNSIRLKLPTPSTTLTAATAPTPSKAPSLNKAPTPSTASSSPWTDYSPSSGGFRILFPQPPYVYNGKTLQDRLTTWQYEAPSATGETYTLLKRRIDNSRFLEEDTLDLSLMEESLKGSAILNRELSRKFGKQDGYDCLDMLFLRKNGGRLRARAVIRGGDYFLLMAASAPSSAATGTAAGASAFTVASEAFFDGFHLTDYHYGPSFAYTDTSRYFTVRTPVGPHIADDLRSLAGLEERYSRYSSLLRESGIYDPSPYNQGANFKSDSTGESIQVNISTMPLYFYRKDSAKFWDSEMHWTKLKEDFILARKEYFQHGDSLCGYRYTLLDTNTNRKIEGLAEVKGNKLFKVTALTDQLHQESSFIRDFFDSFTPLSPAGEGSVFTPKSSLFFHQYFSSDSLTRKITREASAHITLQTKDLPDLERTIATLDPHSDTYIREKIRLILAMGRMARARSMDSVIGCLKHIFDQSDDTSSFQNAVVQSIVRIKKKETYGLIKDWLLQKTPVFENESELQDLFRTIGEDTTLAVSLFPDILRLTSVEDYKRPVVDLLVSLADSGRLRKEAYADYFPNLFLDARLLLKKQQITDNKGRTDDDEEESLIPSRANINWSTQGTLSEGFSGGRSSNSRLAKYAVLLIPFYDRPSVPHFFDQLLQTKLTQLKLTAAMLLVRNGRPVPDSIWLSLAAQDAYRSDLFAQLDKAGRSDLFPAAYKTQEAMARSNLAYTPRYEEPTAIKMVGKKFIHTTAAKGYAYFFLYKLRDGSPWLMAISGVQPEKPNEVSTSHYLVRMTYLPLADDSPVQQQFEKKLQQLLLSKRKSAAHFFQSTALR
jgi:uncharacterized protein YbaP (TraB family)